MQALYIYVQYQIQCMYNCLVQSLCYSLLCFIVGTNVGLVVNNLGGTSNLELSLIAGSAIDYLSESLMHQMIVT